MGWIIFAAYVVGMYFTTRECLTTECAVERVQWFSLVWLSLMSGLAVLGLADIVNGIEKLQSKFDTFDIQVTHALDEIEKHTGRAADELTDRNA